MLAHNLVVLTVGCLALVRAASADPLLQERTITTDQYRVSYWTSEQGLPQNTVSCLLQTRDGYLWIGTRYGLARFDGVRLADYSAQLVDAENDSLDVRDLAEDCQGRLWLLVGQHLACYEEGRFTHYSLRRAPGAGRIERISTCSQGGLWVAWNHGVFRFHEGTPGRVLAMGQELPWGFNQPAQENLDDLVEDATGQLWLRTANQWAARWLRLDARTLTPRFVDDLFGRQLSNISGLDWDDSGHLWLAGADRLFCWEGERLASFETTNAWPQQPVKRVVADRLGGLWIASHGSAQLHRFFKGRLTAFGRDGLPEIPDVRSLCLDREGNLWVGTGGKGLYRVQVRQLVSLLTGSQAAMNDVYSVAPGRDGSVWLAAADGLVKYRAGRFQLYTNPVPEAPPSLRHVRPVIETRAGELFCVLDFEGLFRMRDGTFQRLTSVKPAPGERRFIHSMAEDMQGTLWLATSQGLVERRGGVSRVWTTADGLADNHVFGLLCCSNGSVWIGSLRGGLHELREGRFRQFTTNQGLLSMNAWPLNEEPDGAVWVGTPVGLNRIRGGQVRAVTQREGLYENLAYCLLRDGHSNYWSMGNRGIWRARGVELHAVADRKAARVHCVSYGTADGMASVECNGDEQPNAAALPNGELWFPTTRGVVILDPDNLRDNRVPPPVVIEEVLVDEEAVFRDGACLDDRRGDSLRAQPLRLAPGRARVLEIRYTAPTFIDSDKTRFRYRLEGYENGWHEADTRRVAFYTNLRPGQYRFEVEACNHHGYWSQRAAVFTFRLTPFFHQTWPFYGLCVLAGVASFGGWHLHRLRFTQRVHRLERARALEAERNRIARDLHDDLGASLTGIALQVEGAGIALGLAEMPEPLRQATRSIRALVHRMREVIWSLNPQCDTVESFCTYLSAHAEAFLNDAGIRCRFDLPDEVPPLQMSAEVRYHLFLVAKEALNNAAKHSHATEVRIQLRLDQRAQPTEVRLVIADDGQGFEPDRVATWAEADLNKVPVPRAGQGGWGLRNMRERVAALGGHLHLSSRLGGGTTVSITLSLQKT